MNTYRHAQDVTVIGSLVDADGAALGATACSYRVLDEEGNELVSETSVSGYVSGSDAPTVTVDADVNTLDVTMLRGMRVIEFLATTAGGLQIVKFKYIVEAVATFEVGVNTVQTLEQAELIALEMASLTAWSARTDAEKQRALTEAWMGLTRFVFRSVNDNKSVDIISDLFDYTKSELSEINPELLRGLRRAQVVEADQLMGGNPVAQKRRMGLISETIGESSQFFGTSKPMDTPVSREAMKYIARFINWSVGIGRA